MAYLFDLFYPDWYFMFEINFLGAEVLVVTSWVSFEVLRFCLLLIPM